MALSYLQNAKRSSDMFTHSDANVSPFHDPENSQFGVGASSASGLADLPHALRPSDPPGMGTAAELRGRKKFHLRGSFNRSMSEPKRPPPQSPPDSEHGTDHSTPEDNKDIQYEWNADRLDMLDHEVFTNVASKLTSLDWRVSFIDNKVRQLCGEEGFASEQDIRRRRYNLGELSAAQTPERVSPGNISPAPTPTPALTQEFTIATPNHTMPTASAPPLEAVNSHVSDATVKGGDERASLGTSGSIGATKDDLKELAENISAMETLMLTNNERYQTLQTYVDGQHMVIQQHMTAWNEKITKLDGGHRPEISKSVHALRCL